MYCTTKNLWITNSLTSNAKRPWPPLPPRVHNLLLFHTLLSYTQASLSIATMVNPHSELTNAKLLAWLNWVSYLPLDALECEVRNENTYVAAHKMNHKTGAIEDHITDSKRNSICLSQEHHIDLRSGIASARKRVTEAQHTVAQHVTADNTDIV